MMYLYVKRLLDIILAIILLAVVSPVFGALFLAVRLTSSGNAFFTQRRVGRGKNVFDMIKFRTMRADAPSDVPTHLLKDPYAYITPAGRFLRRTSLDELPQLVNILRGDMSFVGPRPALWNQYDLIAERDRYGANDIRPGLTGLAQVSGRDELPIPQKAAYDGEYRKNMRLLLDCSIMLRTVSSVVRSKGIREGVTEGEPKKRRG